MSQVPSSWKATSYFLTPWGNMIEVVEDRDVKVLKPNAPLDCLKVPHDKSDASRMKLTQKIGA